MNDRLKELHQRVAKMKERAESYNPSMPLEQRYQFGRAAAFQKVLDLIEATPSEEHYENT